LLPFHENPDIPWIMYNEWDLDFDEMVEIEKDSDENVKN